MTLSNTKRVITHAGNGVATEFPFDFLIPSADDIVVRVLNTTTGVITTVDPADFSVVGLGEDAGGEVTYPLSGAPLAGTDEISILREVAYTQDTDIVNQGGFFPDVLMTQLDRIVMQTQQLAEQMDRTIKLSEFDEVGDLDALTTAVQSLVLIEDEILALEAIISTLTAVNDNEANINIVAGLEVSIAAVVNIQAEIATVAGIDTEIAALAAIAADIQTVADNVLDVTNFADVYVGPSATDPATRTDGSALQAGDLYFNTTLDRMKVFNGAVWQLTTADAADVTYDNAGSGLAATDVQEAVDELEARDKIVGRAFGNYVANTNLSIVIPLDDSEPQNNEGTEVISISYTAKKATNRIRLRFTAFGSVDTGGNHLIAALFWSDNVNALNATYQTVQTANNGVQIVLEAEFVVGGVVSKTYSVRVGANSGVARLNGNTVARRFGGQAKATLVLTEIEP